MEKVKKVAIIVLLALCVCPASFAESYKIDGLTDYQNERLALVNTAMNSIVENMTEQELVGWAYWFTNWLQENADAYKISNNDPLGELELLEGYLEETCGIVPWMIGSEDNTILEEYQYRRYNAFCRQYQEGRKALDEKSTKEVLEEELKIQKDRSIARTRIIERVICRDFVKWNQKGEYEKTLNYENRLKERSELALDSICREAINKYWHSFLHYEFKSYDADRELLPLELYYSDKKGNKLMSVMYNISVSPDWVNECQISLYSSWNKSEIVSMGEYNGYLFPLKFIVKPYDYRRSPGDQYGYFPCVAITDGVKPLVIKFDNFKIDNKYLAGKEVIASFDKFYEWQRELLDSIKACNSRLKKHPSFRYDPYGMRVQHAKTIISENKNNITLIEEETINYFTGFEGNAKRWNREKNMINPSQRAYEDFLRAIQIFYDECIDHFEALAEFEKIFPYVRIERTWENTFHYFTLRLKDNIRCGTPTFKGQINYKDSQCDALVMLSASKSSLLQDFYKDICKKMTTDFETVASEYNKNGMYFSSPTDFINAYVVSGNYKAELKAHKQNAK